ncbi:hypothetical protein C0V70_06100 [Bacteriovorax stolpii]|uniref:Uncharacterized protein n=1 Tax=Bacteriovorax stolpii TaxID=960 RepID=A0A2K9NQA1_BACTC|nr:hypothetical protein [Bacteriovorax stolpii]AUN97689.1 hypothetical protein C0V70_06100 [Bacteriovorax stolpii]TDP51508.1 hypothetical protein C8D79_2952 [Bacteriovorax stolpii]
MGCCNKNAEDKTNVITEFTCPKCSNKGVVVELITPQTLLKDVLKEHLRTNCIYKFCKNSNCEVAYFSEDPSHLFTKENLTVKATLKDPGLDVKVCYCFGHNRQSILTELRTSGETEVLKDIKSKMIDPGCFCERSNPQGGCCLGNVTSWIKEAKTHFVT